MLFSARRADTHRPSSAVVGRRRHRPTVIARANFPFPHASRPTAVARASVGKFPNILRNARTQRLARVDVYASGGVIFARSARLAAWRSLKANCRQLWSISSAPTVRPDEPHISLRPHHNHPPKKPIMSLERAVRAKVSANKCISCARAARPDVRFHSRARGRLFISRIV